ncbi:hypothetical protein [Cochleicola gelatinilyticus]|uniref:Lipoprotein n=1 Tax=Cochleicola gelatinilyticus TaxID=1763537 RepID=A0A167IJT5_9FLAO|nr:hypothetical protein [Cochleicola gelatinilyticus]OAB79726.1 hypothetical protein ULVI_02995 [Cochleicola gelatinilyticus]
MKHIYTIIAFTLVLQSCGGIAAGMANRIYIDTPNDKYVAKKINELKPLFLTEEQTQQAESLYLEEIEDLKENAYREKKKEISNSGSLDFIQYRWLKSELLLRNLLTERQLEVYIAPTGMSNYSEKRINRERKKLEKMGYEVPN